MDTSTLISPVVRHPEAASLAYQRRILARPGARDARGHDSTPLVGHQHVSGAHDTLPSRCARPQKLSRRRVTPRGKSVWTCETPLHTRVATAQTQQHRARDRR